MGNKRKQDAFIISNKIHIAVQVDAHMGTHVELYSPVTHSCFLSFWVFPPALV
jgi:hypothetical protein